ncbi:MAG: hypothetical protein Q4B09_02355 [Lachnospiraceae bacterium]|nr:hypothetical protein [Lachnospiraceae bacterium]
MSAFLGPIHFWLYNKVQLQDQLTETLLSAFPEQRDAIAAQLDAEFGALPAGDLGDIIDESNIHGWLQTQVTRVENRLALAVSRLAADENSRQTLFAAAHTAGAAHKLDAVTPEDAFQNLQNVLLDGMPCDHVNAVVPGISDSFCWERINDLHSSYYTQFGADPVLFDEIRDAWVNGMLEGTGLSYRRDGMKFSIEKR